MSPLARHAGRALLLLPTALGLLAVTGGLFAAHDLLAQLASPLLVIAILAFGATIRVAGRLRAPLPLAALLGSLCSAGLMAGDLVARAADQHAPPSRADTVIVSLNLSDRNLDYRPALAAVLGTGADVVTLQEGLAALHDGLPGLGAAYPYRATCTQWWGCEIVILSRRPILASGWSPARGAPPKGAWTVWATTTAADGGRLTVVSTHLGQLLPSSPRRAQERRLAKDLGPLGKRDLVLTGDFNAGGSSWALRRLDRDLAPLVRRTHALPTWPDRLPSLPVTSPVSWLALDHLYAGKSWKTVAVDVLPRTTSDHRGIVVRLRRQAREDAA